MSDSDEEEVSQVVSKGKSRKSKAKKSSKPKPVANFMQTFGLPKISHKTKPQHRKEPSEDSDDDSEELLSISSGDEDAGDGDQKNSNGGGGKDDDTLFEGEPTKWKQVNESEVTHTYIYIYTHSNVSCNLELVYRYFTKGYTFLIIILSSVRRKYRFKEYNVHK